MATSAGVRLYIILKIIPHKSYLEKMIKKSNKINIVLVHNVDKLHPDFFCV
jgi:hypothetical protein